MRTSGTSDPSPGERPGDDQTFADVLNGLTLGGGRRRRGKSTVDKSATPAPPHGGGWSVPNAPAPPGQGGPLDWSWAEHRPDPHDAAAPDIGIPPDAALVRPYSWTRGRTKSIVDLRIEAMVTTSERGDDIESLTQTEHRSVAELCREPRSVAELATLLNVPLGVAKVLLGDMANLGLVIVHKTATGGANKAHLLLMERVLSGLRRL
jgi:hypothetical protein